VIGGRRRAAKYREEKMHRLIRGRMSTSVILAAIVMAFVAFPLGVIASHQFTDVPDSYQFHNDIDAVKDAGVTSGCGDGTTYCPEDFVTRGQMAAFLNRLGALAADKDPVVNAKTSESTDGWSIGCPSGTDLAGGLCFDESTRGTATSALNASDLCADLGSSILTGRGQIWKLPTALELRSAEVNGDIVVSAEEWTSTFYFDGTFRAMSYNGTSLDDDAYTDDHPYRCAALPLQRDTITIIPFTPTR
jgi:hypothetical protein